MEYIGKILVNKYNGSFGKVISGEILIMMKPHNGILLKSATKKDISMFLNSLGKQQLKNYILKKVKIEI